MKSSDSIFLLVSLGKRNLNNRETSDDRDRIEGVVVFSPSVGEQKSRQRGGVFFSSLLSVLFLRVCFSQVFNGGASGLRIIGWTNLSCPICETEY